MRKIIKEEVDDVMKVITLGESGVGKTCIINRYIKDIFEEKSLSTIGIKFAYKQVKLENGKFINIKLVDTAGQEKFRALTKSYFKNVDAVLFIFSINNQDSFDNIINWINLFNENHNGKEGIPMYLIGNKSDQDRIVQKYVVDEFIIKNKYKYYETSAKENSGINELFQDLCEDLYKFFVETGGKRRREQSTQKLSKYDGKNGISICNCMKLNWI